MRYLLLVTLLRRCCFRRRDLRRDFKLEFLFFAITGFLIHRKKCVYCQEIYMESLIIECVISLFICYILATQRTHFEITAFLVGSLAMHFTALLQKSRPMNVTFDKYGVLPLSALFLCRMHRHHSGNTVLMFTGLFVFLSKVYDKILYPTVPRHKSLSDEVVVAVFALMSLTVSYQKTQLFRGRESRCHV